MTISVELLSCETTPRVSASAAGAPRASGSPREIAPRPRRAWSSRCGWILRRSSAVTWWMPATAVVLHANAPDRGRNREVLVRIRATTVSAEDPKRRAFEHPPLLWLPIGVLFGFRRPRKPILGVELAGEVEAVGRDVTRYRYVENGRERGNVVLTMADG
ncbi:alcohol dehydrogenase catalytic domain-containing protein [Sorangium sp. So ce854]|uniref:alcohol dehydrogenase catalytic domain-containing protein n=1 Tax=Sorangium sp. So ce854 TaxID=3133322 RepID=UPI003F61925C